MFSATKSNLRADRTLSAIQEAARAPGSPLDMEEAGPSGGAEDTPGKRIVKAETLEFRLGELPRCFKVWGN